MPELKKVFEDIAAQIVNTQDIEEIIERLEQAYHMGRTSIVFEQRLQTALRDFSGKINVFDIRKQVEKILTKFMKDGLISTSDWKPDIEVVGDKDAPTTMHVSVKTSDGRPEPLPPSSNGTPSKSMWPRSGGRRKDKI